MAVQTVSATIQDVNRRIEGQRLKYTEYPKDLCRFREYAAGNHTVVLTDKQKNIVRNLLGSRFCDNVCHQIVAEARGRLQFEQWECENAATKKWLDDFQITSGINEIAGDVHYSMLQDGNVCYSINYDPDSENVLVYEEPWWDGTSGVYIGYDANRRPAYAVKDWQDTDLNWIRVLWYPDRVEKYISRSPTGPWEPLQEEGRWPIPWVDRNGKPIGLPFVHLANGSRTKGRYGMSELDGGVLGFQDQLNDLQWAMTTGGRMTAFQMIWGTGIRTTDPKTGQPIAPTIGPGEFLGSDKAEARFGRIEAGDMSQIISLYDQKLGRIANMTATPLHRLIGKQWPSGEALMRAEQPAVAKAEVQIAKLTAAYPRIALIATRVWNAYGSGKKLPNDIKVAAIRAKFSSPERRDPLSKSVIVNNLGDRLSDESALRIYGWTEEQIATNTKEKEAAAQRALKNAQAIAATKPQPAPGQPQGGANDKGSQPAPKANVKQQAPTNKNGGN